MQIIHRRSSPFLATICKKRHETFRLAWPEASSFKDHLCGNFFDSKTGIWYYWSPGWSRYDSRRHEVVTNCETGWSQGGKPRESDECKISLLRPLQFRSRRILARNTTSFPRSAATIAYYTRQRFSFFFLSLFFFDLAVRSAATRDGFTTTRLSYSPLFGKKVLPCQFNGWRITRNVPRFLSMSQARKGGARS